MLEKVKSFMISKKFKKYATVFMLSALVALSVISASAEGDANTMTVSGLLTDVGTLLNQVISVIAGNAVLSAILGCTLIAVGARLFKRIRSSVSHG